MHSSTRWNDDDHGQRDDHKSSTAEDADDAGAWKDREHDHHSSSDKHDTFKYGDSFHFKDKISAFEVSDHGHVDHASTTIGYHGYAAPGSEPPTFSEPAQATELASSKHHRSHNFSSGPDHAWSGAHTHAPHHDLMV